MTLSNAIAATNTQDLPQVSCAWSGRPWLIGVFAAIQLCVGLTYFRVASRQAGDWIQGRPVQPGFPLPVPGRFFSGDLQPEIEAAARKYFPLPEETLVPYYRSISQPLAHLALVPILTSRTMPRPLWRGYSLVQAPDGERICGLPNFYLEVDRRKLFRRADYYNGLHTAWPGVRFYVFPILSTADWCAVGGLYGAEAKDHLAGDRYLREFRTLLDAAIGYTWAAEGCLFQDALAYYYRTDHHWTLPGAYKVYRQVHQLLQQRNPRIGPPWEPKGWSEVPGVAFRGSLAHRAGCYAAFGDPIVDGVFDLPELKMRIWNFEGRERNARRQYQAGHFDTAEFAMHYRDYFGADYGVVEYTAGEAGGGGLLVIGDSYDNCIEPLLASHFSHSWFVDPRHYAQDIGNEFVIEDFLARHEVTDVVFLAGQFWTLDAGPPSY